MKTNKTTLGILALTIGALGFVALGTDHSEAVAGPAECPAMSAAACPATAAQCPALTARMAEAAKGKCPALQGRSGQAACPALKAQSACPALQDRNEAEEAQKVNYRKMA